VILGDFNVGTKKIYIYLKLKKNEIINYFITVILLKATTSSKGFENGFKLLFNCK